MNSLLSNGGASALRFVIAFIVVLALIAITTWAIRRFGSRALGVAGGRGRQPRLAVIDATSVDARRRLVLIRRDNVEHLLMIGGPTDVVIEPNIVRGSPAPRVEPAMRSAMDEGPRPLPAEPAPAGQWGGRQTDANVRPERHEPAVDLAPALAPQAPPVAAPTTSADLAPPVGEPALPEAEIRPGAEPARRAPNVAPQVNPRPAAAQPAPADANLAEMAQRLEAALRRPAGGEPRLDIPLAAPAQHAQVGPRTAAEAAAAAASAAEAVSSDHEAGEHEPAKPEAEGSGLAQSRTFYESLEKEMASLLGRPTGKS